MSDQVSLPVQVPSSSQVVLVNARCVLRLEGDQRVVLVSGLPVLRWAEGDAVAEAHAMVQVVDSGWATQVEVAQAFGCSERTVRRHQHRFADGGMPALATSPGWRPGRRRLPGRRLRLIRRLKGEGLPNREIARRLGVTENAVRVQVGPSDTRAAQAVIPFPVPPEPDLSSEEPTNPASTADAEGPAEQVTDYEGEPPLPGQDPLDRSWDRLLACTGKLDDAAPLFAKTQALPGAGVLFALPALVASGIFPVARKLYGEIGPAFYGLRTTLLTLLLMALWRIKRPEALKEHDPRRLGLVLGLDRAPEVKTLRRKLTRLAAHHQADRLGMELARLRVDRRGKLMGFLYIDGHVRVYHGKHTLPKAHVARMRLSLPATTDYWVNDASGEPLFVVTAPANAGLTKMLPVVLGQVRTLIGDRCATIVFDRGGWSPKLFLQLIQEGFDILTYRKGKTRRVPRNRFVLRQAIIEGRKVEYLLADQNVRLLGGRLRLRQVTRLSDDGHQTPVLTSRRDLDDIEVAWRMFERWRQENFFKYMREEFMLDALADHQVEPDDPTRTVPNPERRSWDDKVRAARAEVAELERAYGVAVLDEADGRQATFRGVPLSSEVLAGALAAARERLDDLRRRRREVPIRVEVRDVSKAAVVKLASERKHLTDILKMVAFQAESDLCALLGPHYARAEQEGRTLLHELFRSAADIRPTASELQVTLTPLSSPHRTLAVQAICDQLNATATTFPGTRLRLRYAVHEPTRSGLAFPGPRPPKTGPEPPQPDIS